MSVCKIILIAWLSGTSLALFAQKDSFKDFYDESFGNRPAFYAGLTSTTTFDDFGIGTTLGVINPKRFMKYFFTFEARPYRRKILDHAGGNDYYQFLEERYLIGLGAEYVKDFSTTKTGFFVQLNANYTWGEWSGTQRKPGNGMVLTPRAGVFLRLGKKGFLKFGYSYQDIKSEDINKNRIYLAISSFMSNQ